LLDESTGSYEGLQDNIRKLDTPPVDTWDNKYPEKEYEIEFTISEFTCMCPKTGMPDFATIRITYSPADKCIELKSLKLYMNFYRDVGIFHEHVVNRILEDLVAACAPRWMKIEGEFNVRGGIRTTVRAEHRSK
jgi:7-cyano-7-deazaguanine reductase